MQDNPFHPPNAWWLSDNVISEVAVRHTSTEPDPVRKNSTYSRPRPQSIKQASSQLHQQHHASPPTEQCAPPQRSVVRKTTRRTPPPASGEGANKFSKDLRPAEITLMIHRERRRLIQQRYRKKKDNYTADLEVLVFQLQKEVEELQQTLQDMRPSDGLTESTVWKVAVEYFRLFRDGFKPSVPVSELCRRPTLCADQAHKQTQFFRTVLAPDALLNAGCGLETALEDWRQVSLHHKDLTIELNRMERGPDNSMVAYMDGVTTITAEMLQAALPACKRNDDQMEWRSLNSRLVGQQLVIPSTVYFMWDDRAHRVTSLRYVADMFTPLVTLLGNLEDVGRILGTTLDIHYWSKKANPSYV